MEDYQFKEALIFIKNVGGEATRYAFDKFITINIRIDQSFNVVPRYLLEKGLIEVVHSDDGMKIKLTKEGASVISDIDTPK